MTGRNEAPLELLIEPEGRWSGPQWRELWAYRELLYFFVWRDVKLRYKQTFLGVAWVLLQPISQVAALGLVFGQVAGLSRGTELPYPIYLASGVLPWTLFAASVTGAANSVVSSSHLITKVYFPRLLIPAATVGVAMVDFVLSFGLFLILLPLIGLTPGPGALLLPAVLGLLLMTALGIGSALAAVIVPYRDFRFVLPLLLQLWFYLTPIIYPTTILPRILQQGMDWNPLMGIIGLGRWCLFGTAVRWESVAISAVFAPLALVLGLTAFRRSERRFADLI